MAGILLAASAPAPARAADAFEVSGVAVNVTADTAAAARKTALAGGERTAFYRLLRRMTLLADRDRLPDLGDDEIAAFVQDLEVTQEKTSSVRYLASLNFRFKKESVRGFLIDNYLPFAETKSKTVLVLPVYESAGALLLFDDPNPWRNAWEERSAVRGLVPMVLPRGDLADIAVIGAEQALDGDAQRLRAIAGRYGAYETLVVHGIHRLDASGLPKMEVYATRFSPFQSEQTIVKTYEGRKGEDTKSLLIRAAKGTAALVEDAWKRDNLLQFDKRNVIAVRVLIGGLNDWLGIKKRLDGVAVVRRVELVLLSLNEVRINLHYIGSQEQLSLALEQVDMTLTPAGDGWTLALEKVATGKP